MGLVAVLAIGAGGLFSLQSSRDAGGDSQGAPPERGPAVAAVTAVEPPVAATGEVQPGSSPAPHRANDQRLATLTHKMADFGYDKVGRGLVEELVEQGLARTDSERIIAQAMRDYTVCTLDALRAQATAQSVSFDTVLDALEANEFYFLYRPEVAALIDVEAFRPRENLCAANVRQQVGLPIPQTESNRRAE